MASSPATLSPSAPAVEMSNIQVAFDGRHILNDLSFHLDAGEILCLLGPSGCGKTTALKAIAGLIKPRHGQIDLFSSTVFSKDDLSSEAATDIPPQRRGVGFIFQDYALFPHMTVNENLAFPLEIRKLGKVEREEKVKRALEMVQMGDFGARRIAQLSGGQQQRIALARALVFDPTLVLMDEPLGALDKQLREHMQFEIKRIADNLDITVVYVTHDQTEALTMSDRVAVFDDGRIQQLAPPDRLYEEPENSFVAQFIGENNTLEGVVQEIEGGQALVRLDNGELIDTTPINISSVGERTKVSIRPERVEFDRERLGEAAHTLKAEVLEFIYMGDIFRTRLRVAGNEDFIVKTRNAANQIRFQPGQQIEIGWLPEDCRALDA